MYSGHKYVFFANRAFALFNSCDKGTKIERLTPPNIAPMFESTLLQCSDQHCSNVFRTLTLDLENYTRGPTDLLTCK